jgi:glycosyltransferase involved in cell wall biosynthesis
VSTRGGVDVNVAFHIDQLWFDAPGGIGTYIRALAFGALQREDPTLELTPFHARWSRAPHGPVPLTADGTLGVELAGPIRRLYPSWDRLGRPHLPASLDGCDVVHATNHAAVPPVRDGQRLVVTVHDLAFERFPELFPRTWLRLYRWGTRAAVDRADAILVPSARTKADLADELDADPERIHVTPLASSLEPPAADELPQLREDLADLGVRPPYILAVGTIEPRKNLVRLVRAFRTLRSEGLPHALVLAGPEGGGMEELREELARGGSDGLILTGGIDLRCAYLDADVVAYVSLYEGFGLPVIEAMGLGAPVVASNVSSIPEVAGDAAVLVDPTDEAAIADGLRRVLTDAAFADDLRRRGRERAASFSWAATARATLDVYRQVTGAS